MQTLSKFLFKKANKHKDVDDVYNSYLNNTPPELKMLIASFLDWKSLSILAQVNKSFKSIVESLFIDLHLPLKDKMCLSLIKGSSKYLFCHRKSIDFLRGHTEIGKKRAINVKKIATILLNVNDQNEVGALIFASCLLKKQGNTSTLVYDFILKEMKVRKAFTEQITANDPIAVQIEKILVNIDIRLNSFKSNLKRQQSTTFQINSQKITTLFEHCLHDNLFLDAIKEILMNLSFANLINPNSELTNQIDNMFDHKRASEENDFSSEQSVSLTYE